MTEARRDDCNCRTMGCLLVYRFVYGLWRLCHLLLYKAIYVMYLI
jgi:hypothetical protein